MVHRCQIRDAGARGHLPSIHSRDAPHLCFSAGGLAWPSCGSARITHHRGQREGVATAVAAVTRARRAGMEDFRWGTTETQSPELMVSTVTCHASSLPGHHHCRSTR
jgi:hypothetical protein